VPTGSGSRRTLPRVNRNWPSETGRSKKTRQLLRGRSQLRRGKSASASFNDQNDREYSQNLPVKKGVVPQGVDEGKKDKPRAALKKPSVK